MFKKTIVFAIIFSCGLAVQAVDSAEAFDATKPYEVGSIASDDNAQQAAATCLKWNDELFADMLAVVRQSTFENVDQNVKNVFMKFSEEKQLSGELLSVMAAVPQQAWFDIQGPVYDAQVAFFNKLGQISQGEQAYDAYVELVEELTEKVNAIYRDAFAKHGLVKLS